MTREELAQLLEAEAHNEIAEHIRAGVDPQREFGDDSHPSGVRKALRRSRYGDQYARDALALFADVAAGRVVITDG